MKSSSGGVWMVVYMAHNQHQADLVERMLRDEGFLVRMQALNRAVTGSGVFELRVLASEAEEARRFILENGL